MSESEPKKTGPTPIAQLKLDAAGEEEIFSLIIEGWSYRQIAAKYDVGVSRLCAWFDSNPERRHACARAREVSAQAHEEAAEEAIMDAADPFELAKAKELAIHKRWRAKVVNPRQYGDKVQQEVTGADGGPVNQSLTIQFVDAPK